MKTLKSPLRTLQPTLKTLGRAPRGTSRMRGRAGVERRARWLQEHPLCVDCVELGETRAGFEVDHVIPLIDGGADHESNFATRCGEHHAKKTAWEARERAAGTRAPYPGVLKAGR